MTENPDYEELAARLKEQTQYLQNIIDTHSDLVALTDLKGNFTFIGPSHRMLGWEPEALVGRNVMDLVHPDDFEAIAAAFSGFLADREDGRTVEYRCLRADGTYLWLETVGKFILDEAGNPKEILFISRDFTERKRAEAALEANYILLKTAGETARFGGWSVDLEDNTCTWSDTVADIHEAPHGYAPSVDEAINFYAPEWKGTITRVFTACAREGIPYDEEMEIITLKGKRVWVRATGKAIRNEEGKIIKVQGSFQDITDKKLTEKALKESEERFNLAMEASRDGVYEWDLETKEIYFSPGWKRMLGYEPEELPDDFSVWEKLTRPEDVERSWQVMNEVVEGKRDRFEVEFEMRHKDGHWVPILSRSNIYKDADGKPVRVVGTHMDITESKRQREQLRLSEARYKKAQELGKVGNWEFDLATGEFWGSDEGKKIYGFDPEKDQFSTEEVMSHVIDRDRVDQAMVDLVEKGKPYHIEFDITTKDTGEAKTLVSIAELEKDPAGKPVRVTGVVQDITARKGAEKKLQESEARFKALHNASFGGITIHDKGLILDCNQGLSEITGYSMEELIGMNGLLLIAEESRDLVMANILAGYEKPYEAVGLRKNGETYPVRLEARNVPYKGKQVRTVEFRDITDQKKAEAEKEKLQAQLTQALKMESVGRLAGGVAHDFNNMLGVILGHVEMALLKTSQDSDLYRDLTEIQTAARRSADITRQLLAFARKEIISPRQLDLNDTVESMLNMLRRLIGEDINLVWQPSVPLWPVKMDPSQVDQILVNLCVNARDAIAGVGRLTIQTGQKTFDGEYCGAHPGFSPGDFVLLSVGDNGHGMNRDTLGNLFEPFFTTKDIGKGTGLGLATVYGIVKQNNGFINVYSEPGQGSIFNIYLPRFRQGEVIETEIGEEKTEARGTETILLVEDEEAILELTGMMLEKSGYSVLPAATTAEAIELAQTHTGEIHLLMTDVVMPEMNGRDLAGIITGLQPGIRLLFMSGYTADVIAHQGVLEEGVEFIQKPFSLAEMTRKVREVLDGDKIDFSL